MKNGYYTIDKLCEKLKKKLPLLEHFSPFINSKDNFKKCISTFFHVKSESGIKNCLSTITKALERYKGSKIVKNAVFRQFMGSMTS